MFADFVNGLYAAVAKIPFDWLVWFVWGTYALIFVITFIACVASSRMREVSKRPYLSLTNAYAAVNLALFLLKCELAQSVLITVLFWVVGYIFYGALCAVSRAKRKSKQSGEVKIAPAAEISAPPMKMAPKPVHREIPAAKNSVRLEHAVSVTDKLLVKNLGKTDRQEVEKLKNTFAVLQLKGTLTPAESDILNENFNTLLKLMAKYNV